MKRLPTPMFHASVMVRGNQTRHSLRLRTASHTIREIRPTWDIALSVQRPTKRRRSRVWASMSCQLSDSAWVRPDVSSPPMSRKSRVERTRQASEFRRRLLRWFRRHGRDLPWRRTRDPYRIVVSEFMLQQTQVSRVEAYYHRFLERVPVHRGAGRGSGGYWCGRAGRGWATTAGPPTCTGWPRWWWRSTAGWCRPIRRPWSGCLASAGTPRARSPASPTSGRRRRWIPTSRE